MTDLDRVIACISDREGASVSAVASRLMISRRAARRLLDRAVSAQRLQKYEYHGAWLYQQPRHRLDGDIWIAQEHTV